MVLILLREWPATNMQDNTPAKIPRGKHSVEQIIPNGLGVPWLVLTGTKIGAPASCWRQWENGRFDIMAKSHPRFRHPVDWGDRQVIIEE